MQLGQVFDDALVAVPPVLVFEDEGGTVAAKRFLHTEPVVEVAAFAASVGEKDVDRAGAEEELMGVFVDGLAPKVPDIGLVAAAELVEARAVVAFTFDRLEGAEFIASAFDRLRRRLGIGFK